MYEIECLTSRFRVRWCPRSDRRKAVMIYVALHSLLQILLSKFVVCVVLNCLLQLGLYIEIRIPWKFQVYRLWHSDCGHAIGPHVDVDE